MTVDRRGGDGSKRQLRADARMNEDAILRSAKEVFAAVGVDAPIRRIAASAGVGMATVLRRFPKRSDLIAAVFRREIDECAEAATELSRKFSADEALSAWLYRYADFIATKRGLASALHSGDTAYETFPAYFRSKFEPALQGLLDKAAASGAVREGEDAYDLLRAIGNISTATGADASDHVKRVVSLLIDGLRYRDGHKPGAPV